MDRRSVFNLTQDLFALTAIVDLVHEPLLYARVDGIDTGEQFVLMELELIDPVLFFAYDHHAPKRFAEALVRALNQSVTSQ